jgi:hypothetical protein
MTGFSAVPEAQRKIRELGAQVLGKPLTIAQLARTIETITGVRS